MALEKPNIVPRFTTIDPFSELSRRFSPTVYANNNPLRFIDPDGMQSESVGADGLNNDQWVRNQGDEDKNKESREGNKENEREENLSNSEFKWASKSGYLVHQSANTGAVLRNVNRSNQQNKLKILKILNKATEFADGDQFQVGSYSFRHGMRNDNQTVEEAMNEADKFVRQQFSKAKTLLKQGNISQAYFEFGVGLHTLQDATSPAHGGFQLWNGTENIFEQFSHVQQELSYPGTNSNLQKVTNYYLDWFQSSELALPSTNLFQTIKVDK